MCSRRALTGELAHKGEGVAKGVEEQEAAEERADASRARREEVGEGGRRARENEERPPAREHASTRAREHASTGAAVTRQ